MVHLQRVVQISDSLSGIFHCVFNKNNFSNIVNMSSKIMVQQKHSSPVSTKQVQFCLVCYTSVQISIVKSCEWSQKLLG